MLVVGVIITASYLYFLSFVLERLLARRKRVRLFLRGPAFDSGFVGVDLLAEAGNYHLIVGPQ